MALALAPLDVTVLLEDPRLITIVAQPIVDLNRGRVVGYEALSRFKLDMPMAPDKVFAEAARRGIAEELEAAVIRQALEISRRTPKTASSRSTSIRSTSKRRRCSARSRSMVICPGSSSS